MRMCCRRLSSPTPLIRACQRRVRRLDRAYALLRKTVWSDDSAHSVDCLYIDEGDAWEADAAFDRLRWGGQLVVAGRNATDVHVAAAALREHGGFAMDVHPSKLRLRPAWLPLPFVGSRVHYMVARKVTLVRPGHYSDRFTFDVRLVRDQETGEYVVVKRVPPYRSIAERLRRKFPDADPDLVMDRTRKLVDKVLPVFLTREAGFLALLQRDLPAELRTKVPRALGVERGEDNLVRTLRMQWLRLGGKPLTQLEFARQCASLLAAIHDSAQIIHMDLRLDNMVITQEGVGFIDFGSAVRVDEDLSKSPLLSKLFDEMLSACQLQRMLGEMTQTGRVTSKLFVSAHQKIDRAADLFSLALYINAPHKHPDFEGLVTVEPESTVAEKLRLLTAAILRPKNPERPRYLSAADLMRGIERIAKVSDSHRHPAIAA